MIIMMMIIIIIKEIIIIIIESLLFTRLGGVPTSPDPLPAG